MKLSRTDLRMLVREELSRFKRSRLSESRRGRSGRRLSEGLGGFEMSTSPMEEAWVGEEVLFEFDPSEYTPEEIKQAFRSLNSKGHRVEMDTINPYKFYLQVTHEWEHEEVEEILARGNY